jgi:RND family efflux transporter MFP subunit
MKLRIAVIVGLVLLGVGAVAFVLAPRSDTSASTYLTATVERGDVRSEVAATGSVASTATYGLAFGRSARLIDDDSAAPSSSTTWPVSEVTVEVGDRVTRDQVLATADTSDLELELEIATADWRAAANDLLLAREALETAEDDGTTDDIRRARSTYYGALSRHDQAKQKRAELTETITGATIVSPIDGVVTAVEIATGTDAPESDAIVVAATRLAVETDIVEDDIAALSVGQPATITIDAIGEELSGTVSSIGLSATDSSQSGVVSFPVEIAIEDAPNTLREGMSAEVTVITATASDVLSVPTSAVESAPDGYRVQVLGADGQPTTRTVDVGLVTESRTEITEGLNEAEVVVTGTLNEQQGLPTGGTFVGPGGGGAAPRVIQGGGPSGD